jgi:menaquinone-dependent protoporphyrinogen oxidase
VKPRILVLYATREGQTEKVAERIEERLTALGAEVRRVNARRKTDTACLDLTAFDLLVLGASMHAGGIESELVAYVHDHAETIRAGLRSFFLVLLSAATADPVLRARSLADAHDKLARQLSVPFDDVEAIAGALRYSQYPRPLRWLMRRIAAQAGGDTDTSRDYEYTDWDQVDGYARRLFAAVSG